MVRFNNRFSHSRKIETLFGYGQHCGMTQCDICGADIIRGSGRQRYCGPYNDKNSCAYKAMLQQKKSDYINRKLTGVNEKPIYIYKDSNKPSEILMCDCGNRYIKTRVNQKVCLFCMKYER